MRILLASAAAAAIAFTATPAFAQYGGSPAEQVDGAPSEAESAPEGENTHVDVPSYETADEAEIAGKDQAGEDYALADTDVGMADTDVDVDADADADIDTDMAADELRPVDPGEVDEPADEAGEAMDEVGPEDQGEPLQD